MGHAHQEQGQDAQTARGHAPCFTHGVHPVHGSVADVSIGWLFSTTVTRQLPFADQTVHQTNGKTRVQHDEAERYAKQT